MIRHDMAPYLSSNPKHLHANKNPGAGGAGARKTSNTGVGLVSANVRRDIAVRLALLKT
jgi:hypothetical protein